MTEHSQSPSLSADAGVFRRTRAALAVVRTRLDSRVVFVAVSIGYLLVYLYTIGDIGVADGGSGALSVRVVDDLSRAVVSQGFFRFDAVAIVSIGSVTYLFSPLNVAIAVVLSTLVGANFALTYLGIVQPRACGLEASSGVIAGIPALLSGAACCGPTILLVVGVQASATIVTGFQLLVPIAVAMLVGSLLVVGRQVNPALL